jgi:hypothetical protein
MELFMNIWRDKFRIIFLGISISLGLLTAAPSGYATEQAQQRREGRDVRQDTRQQAQDTKAGCRTADQKSNANCRQDKRDTKQGGRKQARDIKY